MNILFVCPYVPSLIRARSYNILHALARRGHTITLIALQPPGDEGEALPRLREWCDAVHLVPHSRTQTLLNGLKALPRQLPFQAAYSWSAGFVQQAKAVLSRQHFDVAHVEHLRGAVLADSLGRLPVVFDSVDSISLLFGKVLRDAPSVNSRLLAWLDLERTRRFEGGLTARFQQVAITSENDCKALVELGSDANRITVVPNGVDLDYFQPLPIERHPLRLVFSGKMSYHANIAAVEDLAHKIMPLVWKEQPETQLYVVGKDPGPAVQALGELPNVTVTGSVPDMRPYLAEAAIAVTPVRYAVGSQFKVLEAMAMATPVVCSTQSSSSLRTRSGHDILVGDSPEAIARHVLDLLASPQERDRIGAAGRQYVQTWHTWDHAAGVLESLYAKVTRGPTASGTPER